MGEQQILGETSRGDTRLGHWETEQQNHNGCSDDKFYEKPYHVQYEDGELGMSGHGAQGPRRRSSVKRSRPGYRLGRSLSSRKKKKLIWDVTESIDYMPFNNKVTLNSRAVETSGEQRHFYGFSGRTLATLVATLVTGVIIGVTGKMLEAGIDRGVAARNRVLASLIGENELAGQGFMVGLSMTSVTLAAAAVQYMAPGAAGSGVSLVMALLNGNDIAGLLTPMVLVVKLFGTILVRVSSLALGPEAPMVHLGACVASLVFNAGQRTY
jgi:chloride channel 7